MDTFRIPPETAIAYANLKVASLKRSIEFYVNKLGFKADQAGKDSLALSANGKPPYSLYLTEVQDAEPKPARTTGLYHIAVRLPSRADLANALKRLLEYEWRFQGAADHGVSEALYTVDPDGNGLELYADKPRSQWPRVNGHVGMFTDPLDLNDLLNASNNGHRAEIPQGTDVGHVHLQVADLAQAKHFYNEVLGLDVTQADYPGALFLAAGGYHHHIGLNTWAGKGAPPPPATAVGLAAYGLLIPDGNTFKTLRARLEADGAPVEEVRDNGIFKALRTSDPSGNMVELVL